MSKAARISKSFTVEKEVASYVARTRGGRSASDRLNEMLRRAIADEAQEKLALEAAAFFAAAGRKERKETRALQRVSLRSVFRD